MSWDFWMGVSLGRVEQVPLTPEEADGMALGFLTIIGTLVLAALVGWAVYAWINRDRTLTWRSK